MRGPTAWPAAIGIASGDTVMLMADLTRMAWRLKRSGRAMDVAALLDAFVNAVGPQGSVMVPTYNFDLADGAAFDVLQTPGMAGALGNAALVHPSFQRTPHPLHSFAVAGIAREELVASNERSSFGSGSPFAYLHRQRGVLVTLDLPVNNALTFAHFVEEQEKVEYRRYRTYRFRYTDAQGRSDLRDFQLFAKKAGHHMDLTPMDAALERAGALQRGTSDGMHWIRIELPAAYPVIASNLRAGGAECIHQFRWSWWLRDHLKRWGNRIRRTT